MKLRRWNIYIDERRIPKFQLTQNDKTENRNDNKDDIKHSKVNTEVNIIKEVNNKIKKETKTIAINKVNAPVTGDNAKADGADGFNEAKVSTIVRQDARTLVVVMIDCYLYKYD